MSRVVTRLIFGGSLARSGRLLFEKVEDPYRSLRAVEEMLSAASMRVFDKKAVLYLGLWKMVMISLVFLP